MALLFSFENASYLWMFFVYVMVNSVCHSYPAASKSFCAHYCLVLFNAVVYKCLLNIVPCHWISTVIFQPDPLLWAPGSCKGSPDHCDDTIVHIIKVIPKVCLCFVIILTGLLVFSGLQAPSWSKGFSRESCWTAKEATAWTSHTRQAAYFRSLYQLL